MELLTRILVGHHPKIKGSANTGSISFFPDCPLFSTKHRLFVEYPF